MAICKFWQQGNCKFGDNCRFDHTRNTDSRSNNNRFAPLNDQRNYDRNDGNHSRYPGGNSRNTTTARQADHRDRVIDQDLMRKELSSERPIWILSSYSPRADWPKQLFGGPKRELSPEEVRLRHYELVGEGRMQDAVGEAETIYQSAKSQIDNVLRDVNGAIRYLNNGFDEHPNRVDICNESLSNDAPSFGSNTTMQISESSGISTGFGQPSGVGLSSSTATSFGGKVASNANPSSAFGQPSAFGQASVLSPTSAFGQPSLPGQISTFGQPSTGRNPFAVSSPQSALGQSSNPGNSVSGFPQPSGTGSSPFGQASQSMNTTFGQASNPFASKPMALSENGFGRPTSTFGQPSMANSGVQMINNQGFSGNSSTPLDQSSSTFPSHSNGFATAAPVPSTSNGNAFRHPPASTGFGQSATAGGAFGIASQRITNGPATLKVNGTSGKLQEWNGRTVKYVKDQPCYQENDGLWQRIWFADGPPEWVKPEVLPQDLSYGPDTEEQYKCAKQDGRFRDGVIPLLPPKREWTGWNF